MKKFEKQIDSENTVTDYYLDSVTYKPIVTVLDEKDQKYVSITDMNFYDKEQLRELIEVLESVCNTFSISIDQELI